MRLYWYHRATGARLQFDPTTVEGLLEVKALDERAKVATAISAAVAGSYAHLWAKYREGPEWRALRPRTRSDYQAVRDWLGAAADKPLATLDRGQVVRLRDKAATTKGRRFANYVVAVLRLTLTWGKERGLCKDNPAVAVKAIRRPSDARKVNRAWLEYEVQAFLHQCPPQLAPAVALGLFAGMRQGDALRVTWSAYDGKQIRWTASKNSEVCCAPVTERFKEILDDAKAKRGKAVQIAVTAAGTPWTASGFRASFFKRLRTLKAAKAVQEGCTFHGLRHTVGTSARNAGESESRVAAAIGDRSTAMAGLYGRDADKETAQMDVLEGVQKRFANIDWKPAPKRLETASPAKRAKALK